MSPTLAAGSLLRRPWMPFTAITNKFLAPELSAQLTIAPTGRPSVTRNFAPVEPALPTKISICVVERKGLKDELQP